MAASPRLGIVRRWWWLVLVGAALGVGAALVGIRAMPPLYRATSTLFVISPTDASLNQSFVRSYAQMAVHPIVLEWVREMLALPMPPGRLESMVTAHPVPDTQLVEIVVQFGDAALARDIANATAQVFIDQQTAQLPIGLAGPSLRIGQPAITPDQPIGPRPLPALLLGMLVGVLVGLGVAGLLDIPRAVPFPLEEMPPHKPAPATAGPISVGPARVPAPTMGESVGALDILRGLTVAFVAGVILTVPLAATGNLGGGGFRSGSPLPAEHPAATTAAAQVAAVPPTVLPITQTAPLTDLAASVPSVFLAPEIPTAVAAAEIAGATSAAATEPTLDTQREPAADLAASPPGALFEDRFSGDSRLWPSDTQGPAWYEGGGYRLFARQPGQFVAVAAPVRQPLRDAIIVGTFYKVAGPPGGTYGLIVRDGGSTRRDETSQVGNFYVLGVDDQGQYGVWRREGDRWVDLVPLTPSEAVRRGTETNEITVTAIDDRLTLAVNGVEVATVLGAQAQAGRVGIYVGGDFNEVMLNRFQVLPATASAGDASSPATSLQGPRPGNPEVAGPVEPRESEGQAGTTRAPQGFTAAFLREGPTTSARALASLPNGTRLEVLPDTATGDDFTWLRVRTADGVDGWIVSTAVAT